MFAALLQRSQLKEAWDAALAATRKVLSAVYWFATAPIDKATAEAINEIFFEVLIAPSFD